MTTVTFRSDITVRLVQGVGDDRSIVAAARVSTVGSESSADFANDAREGLIAFLIRNRHGTPFEHNSMTFLVEAPIFVFREFHRHRIGWSYNEVSGRYRELDPVFYRPHESRKIVQTGKPGAYMFEVGSRNQYESVSSTLKLVCEGAYEHYRRLLDEGIAREVARMVLPLSTYSSMYATCNARSLMHFLALRTSRSDASFPSTPMHEIEMVADEMEATLRNRFPITHRAFNDHGRVAP